MNKNTIIFSALSILFSFQICKAQTEWVSLESGTNKILYAVDFINANNGIAVGEQGTVLKTSDGGTTWQLVNAYVTNDLNSISYMDEQHAVVVGNDGQIIVTENGGNSWSSHWLPGMQENLFGIDMAPSGKGIACGRQGVILSTTNGGINWTIVQDDESGFFNSVRILNDSVAFIYGESGIAQNYIQKIINGDSLAEFTKFYISYEGEGWEGMIYDGYNFNEDSSITVGRITRFMEVNTSITCNQPWSNPIWNAAFQQDSCVLYGVDFIDNYGVAVGGGAFDSYSIIVESTDSGHNWKQKSVDNKKIPILYDVKLIGNTGYIVGANGTILKKTPEASIPENTNKLNFPIFPNPAVNEATISFNNPNNGKVFINLYNATGQMAAKIYNGSLTAGMQKISLPVQNLNNGIYFVTINCESISYTQKIIIAKN
ncbi:MAG: YCF48-related protein [Lentimicrobiaceae bacterium]|nr:YCF48-related protein [Lentimicrobiaceae bacterium]